MRSFFDQMTPWAQSDGSLHLYALPDEDVQERLTAAAARIDGVAHLPLVPEAWRHFTVRRLSQFDDLKHAELSRLAQCLTDELDGLSPVELAVAAPEISDVAVACVAPRNPGWDALVEAAGRAAAAFGGEVLAPPTSPHLSLAYATGDADSDDVSRRLEGAPEIGAVRLGSVHLVSVTMRPELGWFDWVELANWSL